MITDRRDSMSDADSPTKHKKAVFVMGPPRSGTSAISSVLIKLGVNFGDEKDFIDPSLHEHNPKRFFELSWVNQINEEVFSHLGTSWVDFQLLSGSLLSDPALNKYRLKIYELALKEWGSDCPLIGVKDPRISLLLPLWESVFGNMGYESRCLIVLRHPLGYVKSEGKLVPSGREWTTERLLLDWTRHLLSALYFARGHDLRIVDYDRFAIEPATVVEELRAWLGVSDAGLGEACRVFDKTLYHHNYKGFSSSSEFVDALYESLRTYDGNIQDLSWAMNFFDQLLKLWPVLNAHLAQMEGHVRELHNRLTASQEELDRQEGRFLDVNKELSQAGRRLTEVQVEREELARLFAAMLGQNDISLQAIRTQLEEKTRVFSEREQWLSQRLERANAELGRIKRGLGWRLLVVFGRIKYPYLMPFYNVYGRLKHRYLLPLYRGLRKRSAEPKSAPAVIEPETKTPNRGEQEDHQPGRFSTVGPLGPGPELRTNPVPEISCPPGMRPHVASVDIIICVHDALEVTKECLDSVERQTTAPYRCILVDDGSNEETQTYLADFASSRAALLIRNRRARGYTLAANQGLRISQADYVVLLNSDTIVTPGWLDRLVTCAESDAAIGLVGPLSNAASWQSVPRIADGDDFARNELPRGLNIAEMGGLVAEQSQGLYPRVAFLNGFCLLIKRGVISEIGWFDELHFGRGYGEENDYCLRAARAGWQLAVADDTYVFHHVSKSYSHERRKQMVEVADRVLHEVHDPVVISRGVHQCQNDRTLEGIRARYGVLHERRSVIELGRSLWEGRRVAFILPVSSCGGGPNMVLHEAEAMRRMGVQVGVVNVAANRQDFERAYPDNRVPVIYVDSEHEVSGVLEDFDGVLATIYTSVYLMHRLASKSSGTAMGYYIQDFEPFFFTAGSTEYKRAWDSYTLYPDLVRIVKTEWNRDVVRSNLGVESFVGGATVDIDLYRPRPRRDPDWPVRPLRILAMLRPETSRRAPLLTLEMLSAIRDAHGDNIEIILFGCHAGSAEYRGLVAANPAMANVRNVGILTRRQVAWLMNEVDIFVDFSIFQALGLTAMEAMCCGAAVVVPNVGGSTSFVKDDENGMVVDSASKGSYIEALNSLILEPGRRARIQRQAIYDICEFFPERGAYRTLEALFSRDLAQAPLSAPLSALNDGMA